MRSPHSAPAGDPEAAASGAEAAGITPPSPLPVENCAALFNGDGSPSALQRIERIRTILGPIFPILSAPLLSIACSPCAAMVTELPELWEHHRLCRGAALPQNWRICRTRNRALRRTILIVFISLKIYRKDSIVWQRTKALSRNSNSSSRGVT